jgi:hypothetical protein
MHAQQSCDSKVPGLWFNPCSKQIFCGHFIKISLSPRAWNFVHLENGIQSKSCRMDPVWSESDQIPIRLYLENGIQSKFCKMDSVWSDSTWTPLENGLQSRVLCSGLSPIGQVEECKVLKSSAVPAQLGLEALALASLNLRPGQSCHPWLGAGLAWQRLWLLYAKMNFCV